MSENKCYMVVDEEGKRAGTYAKQVKLYVRKSAAVARARTLNRYNLAQTYRVLEFLLPKGKEVPLDES
jgi:hypothetical protein